MNSAVDSGYARYEELQSEWDTLKREMDSIVTTLARRRNSELTSRKSTVEKRMQEITIEMTEVLSAARQAMPIREVSVAKTMSTLNEKSSSNLWVGIIRRKRLPRHQIERTYDSTDSESELEIDRNLDGEEGLSSSFRLRESMRQDALARDPNLDCKVVTIENGVDCARKRFGQVTGAQEAGKADHDTRAACIAGRAEQKKDVLGGGIATSIAAPTTPGVGQNTTGLTGKNVINVSEDEGLALSLEFSRLERRARNLNQQEERSKDEEEELRGAVLRINELRKWIGTGGLHHHQNTGKVGLPEQAEPSDTRSPSSIRWYRKEDNSAKTPASNKNRPHPKSPFHHSQPKTPSVNNKKEANEETVISAPIVDAAELDFELDNNIEDEEAYEAPKKKAIQSLEAGVASVRALGRKFVRPSGDNGPNRMGGMHTPRSFLMRSGGSKAATSTRASSSPSNPFSQVTEMLSKRGERLGGLAGETDEMSNNASEMLSAAQALRKRQQKKTGLFR